ncbi:hypothetical protein NQ317_007229 [Molorchus minor]|uniref:Uncharacterized protein n=1 Tax=Molorchus minor TaxID=1323400 RepID=A0ABQ9J0X0_9CUCU|nr:hypothetical protein NQ317_007229 [Molorchus minor]
MKTYALILRSKMSQYPELGISLVENSIGEVDEATGGVTLMDVPTGIVPPPIPDRPSPTVNRRGAERVLELAERQNFTLPNIPPNCAIEDYGKKAVRLVKKYIINLFAKEIYCTFKI